MKNLMTQCLWRLAHVALSVAVALRSCAAWLMHKLAFTKETVVCDARSLAALPQRPQAIAFLLDRDTAMYSRPEHTVRRAATLALYAAACGVHYITLYDPHGVVRASPDLLCTLLASEARRLRLYSSSGHTSALLLSTLPRPQALTASVVFLSALRRHLHRRRPSRRRQTVACSMCACAVQRMDGRTLWALHTALQSRHSAARLLPSMRTASRVPCVVRHPPFLHNSLRASFVVISHLVCCSPASFGFPDPDMAVVFGWSTVMSGFQPWQTRLTEFLFVFFFFVSTSLSVHVPNHCMSNETALLEISDTLTGQTLLQHTKSIHTEINALESDFKHTRMHL